MVKKKAKVTLDEDELDAIMMVTQGYGIVCATAEALRQLPRLEGVDVDGFNAAYEKLMEEIRQYLKKRMPTRNWD